MDGESGELTEWEDVLGARTGKSETEGLEWGWPTELGRWFQRINFLVLTALTAVSCSGVIYRLADSLYCCQLVLLWTMQSRVYVLYMLLCAQCVRTSTIRRHVSRSRSNVPSIRAGCWPTVRAPASPVMASSGLYAVTFSVGLGGRPKPPRFCPWARCTECGLHKKRWKEVPLNNTLCGC